VARIAGVQGVHQARPETARSQDPGFGYFVASVVDSLRAGQRFTVWESPDINMRATPTLATDAGELIWRMLELDARGIFHCCGGESVDRTTLARRTVEAFELDGELLRFGPPDSGARLPGPVPHDTSLDATTTAKALGVELPGLCSQLDRLRAEIDSAVGSPA
jgi:dTDP-4-dehydrorhamnose reductase